MDKIANQIMTLEKLGYRVVAEYVPNVRKWEVVIEHWDNKRQCKKPGKTKRTGFLFTEIEINKRSPINVFYDKLEEVRIKLIAHLTNKLKYEQS